MRSRSESWTERLIFTATAVGTDLEKQLEILDSRQKTGASAVLYSEFPTRYWDHDRGIGSTARMPTMKVKKLRAVSHSFLQVLWKALKPHQMALGPW